ncbi:MAG: nucleotidyltransferase [Proteobacteria bacterium]|nr:MAG: nucleotidyltransferase [Pseudomonadota bacterium]
MPKNLPSKEEILTKLKQLKPIYLKEGIEIIGLFGSYAKDEQRTFSDIDIAYKLHHEILSKNYHNGFAKLLRIESIKEELKNTFKKNIDFVANKNTKIFKGLIRV